VTPTGSANAAWSSDGWLYYERPGAGVWRIPAEGGTEEQLALPATERSNYQHFDALPNGSGVLLTRNLGTQREDSIAVLDIQTGEVKTLVRGAMARYARSGHIVYATGDRQLIAQPFDQDRLELTGAPRTVVDDVTVNAGSVAMFGLSESGVLVYQGGRAEEQTVPVWVGRDGSEELLDERLQGRFGRPAISPDGRRIAFEASLDGGADIWIYDLERGGLAQFTTEGTNQRPFWSANGSELGFSGNREGFLGLYARSADGVGPVRLLKAPEGADLPWEGEWTTDGGLVYRHGPNIEGGDVSFTPTPPNGPTEPIVRSASEESAISVSPDGEWLAYEVVEGGESRVYVQPFPGPGGREIVGVGRRPLWSQSGELFYIAADNSSWMVAEVSTDPFRVLSQMSFGSALGLAESVATHNYDVTPDGRRLLAIRPGRSGRSAPVVVLNFFEELNRLVPTN
jgi:hypothetical protein